MWTTISAPEQTGRRMACLLDRACLLRVQSRENCICRAQRDDKQRRATDLGGRRRGRRAVGSSQPDARRRRRRHEPRRGARDPLDQCLADRGSTASGSDARRHRHRCSRVRNREHVPVASTRAPSDRHRSRGFAAASRVGLTIALDSLPITADAIAAAGAAGIPPGRFAAEGGEDYELLVALPPAFGQPEADRFRRECGVALTGIGTVQAGHGVRFELAGRTLELEGFDHFR